MAKRTVVIDPYNQEKIIAVFNAMKWEEESRSSFSTDEHGNPQIVMVFAGKESDFNDKLYVFQQSDKNGRGTYVSTLFPNGFFAESLERYKEAYERKKTYIIEVNSL